MEGKLLAVQSARSSAKCLTCGVTGLGGRGLQPALLRKPVLVIGLAPAALWLARKRGRYKPAALGRLAGGLDYAAIGQAVSRLGRRVRQERDFRMDGHACARMKTNPKAGIRI